MVEKRPFGRTGHLSTAMLCGAAALSRATQAEADGVPDIRLAYSVERIDTAARCGDAEWRIGAWMARHRRDVFANAGGVWHRWASVGHP